MSKSKEVLDLLPKKEELSKADFDALGKAYTEFLAQIKKAIPNIKQTSRAKFLQDKIENAGDEFMDMAGETDGV